MTATYAPAIFSTQVGIQGPPGNGAPGTTTRGGTGAPANTLGIDGDFYLDSATGKLYQRVSGSYTLFMTLVGLQGQPGATGTSTTWRVGSGAPVDGTGNDGDLYLVASAGDVYQRASGHYTLVANIKGLTGATGIAPVWRSGASAPADGTGNDGDLFLLTTTSDVYQRASGHYAIIANIRGATGLTGATGTSTMWRYGSSVPANTVGNDGDLFLLTTTGDVYARASGTYSIVANIKGPMGAGAVWRSGSGAPVDGTGIDGDLYLVTGSGDVYQRSSGHYSLIANIKGVMGAQGTPGAASNTGEIALTDAATISANASTGTAFVITLNQATSQLGIPAGVVTGNYYTFRIIQDATGSRGLTFSGWKFPSGIVPTLSTTPGSVDILNGYYDGTSMNGTLTKAFA